MTGKSLAYWSLVIGLASVALMALFGKESEITGLEEKELKLTEVIDTLRDKNKALEGHIAEIMLTRESPALSLPENNATLLGKAVRLQWQPTLKRVMPVYILNYFKLVPPTYSTKLLIDPSEKPEWSLIFGSQKEKGDPSKSSIQVNAYGDYFWCVQEGTQGETSSCRNFSIYESAWDRLKATRKLIVGATEGEGFHYLNSETQEATGLEVDLIHWIVENLDIPSQPGADNPIAVKFIYRPFEELLDELDDGKFDIALSQFTITKERKKNHPHMKFSRPYLRNTQILLRNTAAAKSLSDEGTILGVIESSSNKEAADRLKDKFGYPHEVRPYNSLGGLINDLLEGSVHFALVDMVSPVFRLKEISEELELYQAEEKIQQELESFYQQQAEEGTSRTFEEFGIAVSTRGDEEMQLLTKINQLLCSREGHEKITKLVGTYKFKNLPPIPPPTPEELDCQWPLVIKSP